MGFVRQYIVVLYNESNVYSLKTGNGGQILMVTKSSAIINLPKKKRVATPFSFVGIIYNPNSTRSSHIKARRLKVMLDKRQTAKVKIYPTEYINHADNIAYDIATTHKKPLIISVSGDGGYNEVINGAMRATKEGANPVCAVMPAGNANDHYRNLSKKPLRRAILDQNIRKIDLIKVSIKKPGNDPVVRYAHSYVGLGLTADVSMELNRQVLNPFKEVVIILGALYRFKPFKISIKNDTLVLDSLICSNINQMAKVLTVSKDGQPHDGMFEISMFAHSDKLRLIARLVRAVTVGLKPTLQTKRYKFKTLEKTTLHLDGEVLLVDKNCQVTIISAEKSLPTIH